MKCVVYSVVWNDVVLENVPGVWDGYFPIASFSYISYV